MTPSLSASLPLHSFGQPLGNCLFCCFFLLLCKQCFVHMLRQDVYIFCVVSEVCGLLFQLLYTLPEIHLLCVLLHLLYGVCSGLDMDCFILSIVSLHYCIWCSSCLLISTISAGMEDCFLAVCGVATTCMDLSSSETNCCFHLASLPLWRSLL